MTTTRQWSHQLSRYILVGLFINGSAYGVYLGLTMWGAHPQLAMSTLYVAGCLASFLLNRKITFAFSGNSRQALRKYILAQFGGYLINFMMLEILTEEFFVDHRIVQASAIVVVATYLFLANKYFVFSDR